MLIWIISMMPHIFGVATARVRSVDVTVLSEWLKGEVLQADPAANLDELILLAAEKHPSDRSAFLADLMASTSLPQLLSVQSVAEILARFDARKETACSLPIKTMPVVGPADASSSGITNRLLSVEFRVADELNGSRHADAGSVVAARTAGFDQSGDYKYLVQPRGP